MSIFIDKDTKVIVQGITGSEGWRHTQRMVKAGTKVVGGVNPRKAGQVLEAETSDGIIMKLPVFATVSDAVNETQATASVIFVPPAFVKGAVLEAVDASIKLIVVITEGIPQADSAYFQAYARAKGTRIIGPNCPGIVTPAQGNLGDTDLGSNIGIIPDGISKRGPIGLVSKSGTLTYQFMHDLTDIGFSTAIGIGGDSAAGMGYADILEQFEADPETEVILLCGEIGGNAEGVAANYIQKHIKKPVFAYIAGVTAPEGKTMGHAGAIVEGGKGTAEAKKADLEAVGVKVGQTPTDVANLVRASFTKKPQSSGSYTDA